MPLLLIRGITLFEEKMSHTLSNSLSPILYNGGFRCGGVDSRTATITLIIANTYTQPTTHRPNSSFTTKLVTTTCFPACSSQS